MNSVIYWNTKTRVPVLGATHFVIPDIGEWAKKAREKRYLESAGSNDSLRTNINTYFNKDDDGYFRPNNLFTENVYINDYMLTRRKNKTFPDPKFNAAEIRERQTLAQQNVGLAPVATLPPPPPPAITYAPAVRVEPVTSAEAPKFDPSMIQKLRMSIQQPSGVTQKAPTTEEMKARAAANLANVKAFEAMYKQFVPQGRVGAAAAQVYKQEPATSVAELQARAAAELKAKINVAVVPVQAAKSYDALATVKSSPAFPPLPELPVRAVPQGTAATVAKGMDLPLLNPNALSSLTPVGALTPAAAGLIAPAGLAPAGLTYPAGAGLFTPTAAFPGSFTIYTPTAQTPAGYLPSLPTAPVPQFTTMPEFNADELEAASTLSDFSGGL